MQDVLEKWQKDDPALGLKLEGRISYASAKLRKQCALKAAAKPDKRGDLVSQFRGLDLNDYSEHPPVSYYQTGPTILDLLHFAYTMSVYLSQSVAFSATMTASTSLMNLSWHTTTFHRDSTTTTD